MCKDAIRFEMVRIIAHIGQSDILTVLDYRTALLCESTLRESTQTRLECRMKVCAKIRTILERYESLHIFYNMKCQTCASIALQSYAN